VSIELDYRLNGVEPEVLLRAAGCVFEELDL
jgi:hypothetical protein